MKIIFISILLTFSSCSLLISNFEKDILEKNEILPLSQTKKTTCKIIQKNILLSENKESQKSFNNFLADISKRRRKIAFIDKAVLWSLLQMNLRPDLSSPSAKLQVLIKINGKEEYLNSFSTRSGLFPYLKALETLLKKYKSHYSLSQLAQDIDQNFKASLFVSKRFEEFLSIRKSDLLKKPYLKKSFLRGDESLKENERIPKLYLKDLIHSYKKKRTSSGYKKNQFLFSYNDNSSITPKCNFDMSLYKDSLFLIHDKKVKGHIFGIKSQTDSFMAVSSQDISSLQTFKNSFFFLGTSDTRSASLCSFKSKLKKDNTLWLISTDSRDPGQYLFNLLQYGIEQARSISELNSILQFSRHQFLKNPVRLVIESRKSTPQQLNELLKFNIPIYNAKSLGTIWGYFQNSDKSTFLLDDRRAGHLECSSK